MPTKGKVRAAAPHASSRARILLLIESPTIGNLAELTLRHGPYEVRRLQSPVDAAAALKELQPHLMILDVDDDEGRAIDLISASEREGRTPIIALTRRSDLRRQLEAFELGADDCIGIPFVPSDLAARVLAVLRRAYGKTPLTYQPLRLGDLEIDLVARNVRVKGEDLHLTSLEQALLYLLASNAGTVLSREVIMDSIWGTDFLADSNVIDQHVRSLRVKLQNDWRHPNYIATVPGVGYQFKVNETPN